MQCNLEKFQPGQIEFLNENLEGIKATLDCLPIWLYVELVNILVLVDRFFIRNALLLYSGIL